VEHPPAELHKGLRAGRTSQENIGDRTRAERRKSVPECDQGIVTRGMSKKMAGKKVWQNGPSGSPLKQKRKSANLRTINTAVLGGLSCRLNQRARKKRAGEKKHHLKVSIWGGGKKARSGGKKENHQPVFFTSKRAQGTLRKGSRGGQQGRSHTVRDGNGGEEEVTREGFQKAYREEDHRSATGNEKKRDGAYRGEQRKRSKTALSR